MLGLRSFTYSRGLPRAAARDPALRAAKLDTPICFSHPFFRSYDFLPGWLNQLLCTYNRIFLAQTGTPQAKALTNIFSRLQYTTSAILAFESFRQPGFLAQRGLWWLLISQVTSIGATMPLFLALAASRSTSVVSRTVKPAQAWSILVSLLVGYLGPSLYVTRAGWSYNSLSIWQAYPLYLIAICLVLPPLLGRFTQTNAPIEKQSQVPIIAISVVGVAISAQAHFKFLGSGIDFRDLVLVFPQRDRVPAGSITPVAHLIFLVDMVSSFVAGCAHVILSFHGEDAERKLGYCLVLLALTNFIGPGGALAAVWAIRETYGLGLARKEVAKIEARKSR